MSIDHARRMSNSLTVVKLVLDCLLRAFQGTRTCRIESCIAGIIRIMLQVIMLQVMLQALGHGLAIHERGSIRGKALVPELS